MEVYGKGLYSVVGRELYFKRLTMDYHLPALLVNHFFINLSDVEIKLIFEYSNLNLNTYQIHIFKQRLLSTLR